MIRGLERLRLGLKPDAFIAHADYGAHAASVNTGGKHGESSMPARTTPNEHMDVDEVKIDQEVPG